MAYSKVNNTTYANLAKVNNVAKANIAKIDNVDVPSSGATYWVGLQDDAQVSWALNANLSTNGAAAWTSYDGDPTATVPKSDTRQTPKMVTPGLPST